MRKSVVFRGNTYAKVFSVQLARVGIARFFFSLFVWRLTRRRVATPRGTDATAAPRRPAGRLFRSHAAGAGVSGAWSLRKPLTTDRRKLASEAERLARRKSQSWLGRAVFKSWSSKSSRRWNVDLREGSSPPSPYRLLPTHGVCLDLGRMRKFKYGQAVFSRRTRALPVKTSP